MSVQEESGITYNGLANFGYNAAPYYMVIDASNTVDNNTYTVTTSEMVSDCYSVNPYDIDYEANRCKIDDSYFDMILNGKLRDSIHIDINYDRTNSRELKDYLFKSLKGLLDDFVTRGIIESYGISRIGFIYKYIRVEYYIFRNNVFLKLDKYYRYESNNYGLR